MSTPQPRSTPQSGRAPRTYDELRAAISNRHGVLSKRLRQVAEFALAGLGENEAFLSTLREEQIETIHSQETTLESIFIRVTGQSLT